MSTNLDIKVRSLDGSIIQVTIPQVTVGGGGGGGVGGGDDVYVGTVPMIMHRIYRSL